MTQATGQSNPQVSKPWEQNWNDTPTKFEDTATTTVAAPLAKEAPWERMWGSNSVPDAPRNVPIVPTSSKQPQGAEWDKINTKYAQGASERSQSQLQILQDELSKETRPQFIASLQREISRVKGK